MSLCATHPNNAPVASTLRWLWIGLTSATLIAASGFPLQSAQAASVDCLPMQQPLVKIPEIVSHNGVLRGTMLLNDELQRVNFRTPPQSVPGDLTQRTADTCFAQYMRAYHIGGRPLPPPGSLTEPLPGPTLRARVGDIIELTFLNQINPADFGNSIDMDLKSGGTGCDEVSGIYPGKDTFPDCFHGSTTGNIHFHGTHTNPNSTGDNVLIELRPSNAQQDGTNAVTAKTYDQAFKKFFADCENELKGNPLSQWPTSWDQLPSEYTADQKARLQKYDSQSGQNLWGIDEQALLAGGWPQYYIGAYPYCFQLPQYTAETFPPPSGLQMGQSPGTHWYHAHKHGSTNINVQNGMSGVFVIEGAYDDKLNAFYNRVPNWTRTQPVMLVNQIGGTPNKEHPNVGRTDKGPDFSVNGRLQPTITMYPGEVQMWRIANSSPRSTIYIPFLPEGFTWRQLAQDGVQFAPDNYDKSLNQPLRIAPGNRVDLLVKAPLKPHLLLAPLPVLPNVASAEIHIVPNAQAIGYPSALPPPVPLLWIAVAGQGPEMQLIPKDNLAPLPPYLSDIGDSEIEGRKTITFASAGPGSAVQHTINGVQFNEKHPQDWVKLDKVNTVEEWTIVNDTTFQPIDHPFHIHINPFQVTEVFDPNQVVTVKGAPAYKYIFDPAAKLPQCYINPLDKTTWKPCDQTKSSQLIWWDVFPIPSGRTALDANGNKILGPDKKPITIGGYFEMRSRFDDYRGIFVLHCHILAHEDRGMMTIVSIDEPLRVLMCVSHH
jgi:FtsP/CotA-like multicopper oxidase with cupredoxin domain